MIVKAHFMDAHEDFVVTNNLTKTTPHFTQYAGFPQVVEKIFTVDPGKSSMLSLMTEELLFVSGVPILDDEGKAMISLDSDNITDDITSIQSLSRLIDNVAIRLICFGHTRFASKGGYYIIRYPSHFMDGDTVTVKRDQVISVFVDQHFIGDEKGNTDMICELMENLLYTRYDSDVYINNSDTNDLMPYVSIDGSVNTNYSSTGVIVVPDHMTWSTANFTASHVTNLILNLAGILTKQELQSYLSNSCGRQWIFYDYLEDLLNIIYDQKLWSPSAMSTDELSDFYNKTVCWLAKKMLAENYDFVESE